ncbi:hypothetical protein IN43_16970 [Salmonella enterica]|nr:hypothetical protein IN43_16970 [Salmonella enterica]
MCIFISLISDSSDDAEYRKGAGFTGWIYQQSTERMIPVRPEIEKARECEPLKNKNLAEAKF